MAEDEKDVQKDEVSEETESKTETEETETEEEVKPQYVTKEDLQQMLAEERDKIKQSARDISRSQIERARASDDIAGDFEESLGDIDPEQKGRIKAEAKLKRYERRDREEAQRQAAEQAIKDFEGSLTEHITDLGLNPNDKRLDWDKDLPIATPGYFYTRQSKLLKSVAKIQKEEAKAADEKRSQEMKDMEDRLRKEFGGDSVDTSASGGASGSDGDFLAKWNSGELEATKENLARAKKLTE